MFRTLLGVVVLAGCPAPVHYGYQYKITQQFDTGNEVPEPAPREARDLLAGAKTVAFFPPDHCLNSEVGEQKSKELGASCGVLLSTLERAAERAGYEVVSWQNLRGRDKRPIDYAREANVDVLFEINEFELTTLDDQAIERTVSFFQSTDKGDKELGVDQNLARKCAEYAKARDAAQPAAISGAIDIKTVAVADGRDRWHYRKTVSRGLEHAYPRVTFNAPVQRSWYVKAMTLIGGISFGEGVAAEIVSSQLNKSDGSKSFDPSPWSWIAIVGGAALLGGAIAVYYKVDSEGPPPDTVLCDDTHADVKTAPIVVGAMSATHTFTESTVKDVFAKEREQIRNGMIAEFVGLLGEVHPRH